MVNMNEMHDIKISFMISANSKVANRILDKVIKLLYKCGVKFITVTNEVSIDFDENEEPNLPKDL